MVKKLGQENSGFELELSPENKDNGSSFEGKNYNLQNSQNGFSKKVDDDTVKMKREIGLIGGISMIVGTMIGSGIFVSPQGLMDRTDSVATSLVIWAGCGVLSTLTALCYCELGTVVPRSGGEHAYFMEAYKPLHKFFGELPSFLFAWMTMLLLKPSSLAIISLTFGTYAMNPFIHPSGSISEDWKENSYNYELARKFLAIVAATLIGFVNVWSVKLAGRIQIFFTVSKLVAISLVVVIGIVKFAQGNRVGFPDGFDKSDIGYGDISLAFYSGLWAYDGWNNLNFLTEELKNPHKNLPRAIIIGIPLVTVCYILVNLSYLTILSKDVMIKEDAVAITYGDMTLGSVSFIVPVLVALSALGSSNGSQFTAGRISYVAARDGHTVNFISYVHAERLTPAIAISLNVLISFILIFASNINELIDFFSIVSWIFYSLALVSLIVLRYTKPDIKRPFKIPIFVPIIALMISLFLVIAPIVSDPQWQYLFALGFSLIGVCIYYPFVYKKYQPSFMRDATILIQKITLSAPSPYNPKEED